MLRYFLFAVFVGCAAANNITIVFENAHFRGHFLGVNATTPPVGAIRNPPVSQIHHWVLNWELIFRPQGSIITSSFTPNSMATTGLETAPLVLATTATPWKMSYRVDSNKYLYKIEMLAATGNAVMGCLFDNGRFPIVTAVVNCANDNLRAWWNIYSV